jgi:hypothetical protein
MANQELHMIEIHGKYNSAKILNIIKPIYNFKAAEDEKPWEKKKG